MEKKKTQGQLKKNIFFLLSKKSHILEQQQKKINLKSFTLKK